LFEQTVPHEPQFEAFVASTISQPSVCLLLLQSAVPALQLPLQAPAAQLGLVMLLFEQTVPHEPQFEAFVASTTSQPSVCLFALQSAVPALQLPLQTPAAQLGVAILVFEQAVPHAPQFATVVLRFVSQPSLCLLALQSP
jgi:hypothetical protein